LNRFKYYIRKMPWDVRNVRHKSYNKVLYTAAKYYSFAEFQQQLSSFSIDHRVNWNRALKGAVYSKDPQRSEIIKLLIEYGANNLHKALLEACYLNDSQLIIYLINHISRKDFGYIICPPMSLNIFDMDKYFKNSSKIRERNAKLDQYLRIIINQVKL
jgi:hypothetical protein